MFAVNTYATEANCTTAVKALIATVKKLSYGSSKSSGEKIY